MVLVLACHRLPVLLVAKQLSVRADCLVCNQEAPVVLIFNQPEGLRHSWEGLLHIGNAHWASLVVDLAPRLKT